jgi:hypothetical protein
MTAVFVEGFAILARRAIGSHFQPSLPKLAGWTLVLSINLYLFGLPSSFLIQSSHILHLEFFDS